MSIVPFIAILASLTGLGASAYIHRKKRTKTKMVCPLRANCDKVVHSTFSTTFGIPNELLGMAYYIVIGSLYALRLAFPESFDVAMVHYITVLLTSGAALFSLYLVALQAVVIRAWCSWCLVSALANLVLAACLVGLPGEGMLAMLAAQRTLWTIMHTLGFILGLGAATITDILFFRFLKDHVISEEEKGTLDTLSSVIWVGLAILVVSGVMLFLPEQARLGESAKFLLKVVVVGVVILNGIALNLYVAPGLRRLSFENTPPARHFRRIAFALGGISIASWYTAFILGSIRSLGVYSLSHGLLGYGILLVATVLLTQLFERAAAPRMRPLAPVPPREPGF